ncbi:uncharacterized protein PHACADRAFT_207955 [Phanerochaete carnosa HHB-10118-sp]|uniref:USP domain-containing protein n=1 Tax=Phanerochaete carnosa (strain HHB-10118-sp) TaxID=650164 RepID=K5WCN2_PHACS|nr:uncharacterized protein PHACADRAFT_207955 [Phanerochaete carnosa HHB-10118-sp]EKM56764.1 hypothetical protein PHACADRAFT_207955 [Phanerochaete carnosa HHB-10118-sp]
MTATAAEGPFRPAPPTPVESQKMNQVLEVLAGACTEQQVLSLLRRHSGNIERTIQALLDDPNSGMDTTPTTDDFLGLHSLREADMQMRAQAPPHPRSPPPSRPEKPEVPPIDLTADDESEDLKRAMAMSLEESGPTFGPSTRAPDPNWAVVPSNVAVSALSQDDQDMHQAIEASLSETLSTEQPSKKPLEERIRQGETPVALRVSNPRHIYAAMVLHALYFVPQVRKAICSYFPISTPAEISEITLDPDNAIVPPGGGPGRKVWALLETFVYMEYSRLSELHADQLIEDIAVDPWSRPNEGPGDLAFAFYEKIALAVESALHADAATDALKQDSWQRLFFFRHGPSNLEPYRGPFTQNCDCAIAKISVYGFLDANDLVTCLAKELKEASDDPLAPQLILKPSDVVAFQLTRSSSDRLRFNFPAYFYLDRFLYDKASMAGEKRKLQQELLGEVVQLEATRAALTKFEGRDILADLRSAAYYYENVVEDDSDEMRRGTVQDTAATLRKIIGQIEAELESTEASIEKCKAEAERAFDCPGLQDFRYELRAVLMHDGFYGRSHLYSYVKRRGIWWKTAENTTIEVPEAEVLEDPAGLHLGAGPFLLIYSRSVPQEEESVKLPWPEGIKNDVKENNMAFFEELGPEALANIEDPNSPLTTIQAMAIDTPTDSSSMVVEPPSRADPMDLDS